LFWFGYMHHKYFTWPWTLNKNIIFLSKSTNYSTFWPIKIFLVAWQTNITFIYTINLNKMFNGRNTNFKLSFVEISYAPEYRKTAVRFPCGIVMFLASNLFFVYIKYKDVRKKYHFLCKPFKVQITWFCCRL
jgi:hypothetical protein